VIGKATPGARAWQRERTPTSILSVNLGSETSYPKSSPDSVPFLLNQSKLYYHQLQPAMGPPTGAQIIARSLRDLGVTVLFGIVGIPVVEIAEEAINLGIRFIGFRNEQAASYAASAYGYLTGRPGVCLVVGGPGVLHAMAGVRPFSPYCAWP